MTGASGTTPRTAADPGLSEPISAAVLAVPGVVRLSPGAFGEVATHLGGRRVTGVRHRGGRWQVHLVAWFGTDLGALSQRVQDAAATLTTDPVDVWIDDVEGPS